MFQIKRIIYLLFYDSSDNDWLFTGQGVCGDGWMLLWSQTNLNCKAIGNEEG